MWKTGDPEMATPKRLRTYRPKHSDTSLSRGWRINMARKKNKYRYENWVKNAGKAIELAVTMQRRLRTPKVKILSVESVQKMI